MVDLFPVVRFSRSVALLLMVALFVFAGCRILSPKSSPPPPPAPPLPVPPVVPTPLPNRIEQDPYSAFRPIMPEQFVQPVPLPVVPVQPAPTHEVPAQPAPILEYDSAPPLIERQPDTATQKIEELNRKITELEAQVAEARQHSPDVVLVADDLTEPETPPAKKTATRLPIINKPGVTVYADELQRVRIAVMDKSLFMSNTWQLSAEGEETLRNIAAEIRAFNPQADMDIEGHTDSLMNDPNNPMQKHDISATKAKTVLEFFVTTLRWDVAQIGTSSFGRSRPVADNGTPEGRARNNRVEIVLRNRNE